MSKSEVALGGQDRCVECCVTRSRSLETVLEWQKNDRNCDMVKMIVAGDERSSTTESVVTK